ncbi:MAG: carboxymuconolactone decarboxylase family protein [Chloroflexota bacterium]|nr:carboxymuconolactone decarboxylase family protein [Chloroflexota bacterium]MDE3193193.1 carboxymuconolactone decarboxylase family protein [Chloroflexota bacterium]
MDTNAVGSSKGGASAEKIDAVARWRESGLFDDREQAALGLAEAMSTTPASVSDEVFADVRARFTNEEIVELVCALAMENYRARFNRAFGVESQGFYRRAST